jgi:hypothetical protein
MGLEDPLHAGARRDPVVARIRGIDANRPVGSTIATLSRGGLTVSRFPGNGWFAGVAITLLIGGCTEPRAHGPVVLHAAAASGYAPIWVNRDLTPIDQPTAIGSMVVGIASDGKKLVIAGIDPATGTIRWRQPVTPGDITPGEGIHVTAIGDDRVAYLRPTSAGPEFAQLVIADARTGEDLATSPPELFDAPPYACANGKDACAVSHAVLGGKVRQYRLEVDTDSYVVESESFRNGTRLLESPHLLDLGDRPENTLGWLRDGKLQWSIPASAAFPAGFSSDNGWTWHRFADQHVVVGSLYGESVATGEVSLRDLASSAATVGLSETTGKVLWRDRGSSFHCRFDWRDRPVRCRRRGRVSSQRGAAAVFEDLDVTVEGFDPETGETTWSVPVGPAKVLVTSRANLAIAGPTHVVLDRPDGPIVLDYATGTTHVPPPGAAYWCMVHVEYESAWSYTTWDGTRRYDRPGGDRAAICGVRGGPSTGLPSLEATMAAGAHAGAYAVIAGQRGYVGFRLR